MNLLQQMLKIDPKDRISSKDALNHPAFDIVLSKSPLIVRKLFNPDELLKFKRMTEEYFK